MGLKIPWLVPPRHRKECRGRQTATRSSPPSRPTAGWESASSELPPRRTQENLTPKTLRDSLDNSPKVPKMGTLFLTLAREHGTKTMRIISKKTLKDYWEREPATRAALEAWH